jgi:putative SOS response-associated peptidase YedK
MCGRFTVTERDLVRLARALGAQVDRALAEEWRPRFNVAPGSSALVVREAGGLRLERARFGFDGAGPGKLQFNARVETAARKSPFRAAWAGRRCAVPADGFFEWGGPARDRRPVWFHDPLGRPLLFAALYGVEGGALAFSILTTAASGPVSALHDRMPVLVPEGALAAWLGGGEPPAPQEGALVGRPVSLRVNATENDDPGCLDAPGPEHQLRLF